MTTRETAGQRLDSILQKITQRLGVNPPNKQVSFWALELFWRYDWIRSTIRDKRRRLTKNMVKGMYHQEIYDNSKIKKALEFAFEPLDETLDFCCEKFKA